MASVGYKSSAGKAAKKASDIAADSLPPRNPDLNVLDYTSWHGINIRMREQERRFKKGKRETKAQFLMRLRETAMGLPLSVVKRAVQDMHRRVRLVIARHGGQFKESEAPRPSLLQRRVPSASTVI